METKLKYAMAVLMLIYKMSFSLSPAPTGLNGNSQAPTSIDLSWTNTATTNIVGYTIAYSTSAAFNSSTQYKSITGAALLYTTVTGLAANTRYYFAIKSEGASDTYDSPYTAWANAISLIGTNTTSRPTNVICTPLSSTSIQVNWTAPASLTNILGSSLAWNTTPLLPTATYAWVNGVLSTSYIINGLTPSTTYNVALKSEGTLDSYDSPFTTFVSCATLANGGTTTTSPTNVVALALSSSSIKLTWTPPSNITNLVGYTIASNTSSNFNGSTFNWVNGGGTNSYTINGLNANTTYYFAIKSEGSSDAYDSQWASFVSGTTQQGTTSGGGVPQFNKIVVVIGENTNASAVFGSSNAPYINALANAGAKFTNSFALTHPSQGNYLMLFSGSNQGVTGDGYCGPFNAPNLAKELINAGKTFTIYSEDLPSVGYDGSSSGGYARKHNPLAPFVGTGNNQVPGNLNQPYWAFPTNFNSLPNVSFVIPNQCNDGHDVCGPYNNRTKQYDVWIQNHLDAYKQWCKNNNSLLIVTYDEDDFTSTNKISTVFYGAYVMTGSYSQSINHYNVLRTIEEAFSLTSHAGQAANVGPINYCWQSTPYVVTNTSTDPDAVQATIISTEYIGLDFQRYDMPYSELPRGITIVEVNHMSDGTTARKKFIVKDSINN